MSEKYSSILSKPIAWWLICEQYRNQYTFYFQFTHSFFNKHFANAYYIPWIAEGTGEIKITKGGHKVHINWMIKTPYKWAHGNVYVLS